MAGPHPGGLTDPNTELLARCSFPPPGSPLTCAVSGGADSLALLVLTIALLGVLHRRGPGRAYWSSFALCGWLYLLVNFGPWFETQISPDLLTTALLDIMHPWVVAPLRPIGNQQHP